MENLYIYKARVKRIIDGDTIIADIDLGFNVWIKDVRVRLARIEAPNKKNGLEQWERSKKALADKLLMEEEIIIKTIKDKEDKYGRMLGEIWLDKENINSWMVEKGYATIYG
ncbi:MAG: thermonuclease family protein [Bacillota bacterium]